MNYSKLLIAPFIGLLITACGQTGPLYLPDDPAPVHVPKEQPADIEPDEED